jgi:hypothetical protein
MARVWNAAGIDIVSLAGNHAMDWRAQARARRAQPRGHCDSCVLLGAARRTGCGQPGVATPDDPKFAEIVKFTEWVSDRHPHQFRLDGNDVVVDINPS